MTKFSNNFQKVSVIIPAYNKEQNFEKYLQILHQQLEKIPYDYEVVIVNDGSNDQTLKKALNYIQNNATTKFRILSYPLNVGKGFALCYGFTQTSGDPIVFFDADLDLHPRQIHLLLEYLIQYDADIVVGSRRHPDTQSNYPWLRRHLSRIYQLIIRLLFGLNIRDTQLGLKIFRRQVLETIIPRLTIKQWVFDVEVLIAAYQNGFTKIKEAPIVLTYQKFNSTVNIGTIFNICKDTLAIFYRYYLKRHYQKPFRVNPFLYPPFPQND